MSLPIWAWRRAGGTARLCLFTIVLPGGVVRVGRFHIAVEPGHPVDEPELTADQQREGKQDIAAVIGQDTQDPRRQAQCRSGSQAAGPGKVTGGMGMVLRFKKTRSPKVHSLAQLLRSVGGGKARGFHQVHRSTRATGTAALQPSQWRESRARVRSGSTVMRE